MTLREMMLIRINNMKHESSGFSMSLMRWQNVYGKGKDGIINTHISEMDFSILDDDDLLLMYERIVRRYYSQM